MSDPHQQSALPVAQNHPGWQGILDSGERILWQGQPDRRFRVDFGNLRGVVPGFAITCFSLFWMYQAAKGSIFFAMFGLIFLFAGLRQFFGPIIMPAFLRSRSWYTLTDRRAIVATDLPFRGRRLTSYPIDRDTPVELVSGDPPSILFGHPAVDRSRRGAFSHIPEADHVMSLIHQIQRAPLPSDDSDKAP